MNVGEELIGYAHTTGGEKPFIYSYYWDIIESGQTNNWKYVRTDKDTDRQVFPYGETAVLYVYVKDSLGRSALSEKIAIDITNAVPNPLSGTVTVNKSVVAPGVSFEVSVAPSGGEPPYRYLYTFDYEGIDFAKDYSSNNASFTHTLNKEARWNITVTVGDIYERVLKLKTSIDVVFKPGDTSGDGVLDITDLVGSIHSFLFPDYQLANPLAEDATGDGTVNLHDLAWVINQLL